jgi:prepilin-type N-terminal cleavage/methylation domain-containing protein/prepilin-type processing-associated H-X9-DG protein
MRGRRSPAAFTLIELLVVIAIIAILAAILFPVFAQAREKARQTTCLSNAKQLAMGVSMFAQDFNEYLPKAYFNDVVDGPTGWPWNTGWDTAIQAYVKNLQVFKCPSDSLDPARGSWMVPNPGIPGSFRYNLSNHPNGPWDALSLAALDRPAEAILISESNPGVNGWNWHQVATWEDFPGLVCIDFTNNTGFDRHISKVAGRHAKGAGGWESATAEPLNRSERDRGMSNYIFADGHAKALPWAQTWKRIGPDTTSGGQTVTPTMWRQNFSGWADRCNWREGQNR